MSTPTIGSSYQVFSPYTGTDQATAVSPYLIPPNNQSVASVSYGSAITLKLTIANAGAFTYSNDDFKFASGQTTILANNLWKAADSARTTLMGNFTDFLQNVEAGLELLGTVPLGTAYQLGQALADVIPAPLLETLFYRYSLDPGTAGGSLPMVDVRPGMVLRVETEASQLVGSGSNLNGYVGAGTFRFRVSSIPAANGGRVVTFDPFLGTIQSPNTGGPSGTAPVVAGGLVDLCQSSLARAYVRLFNPASMSAASSGGNQSINNNPALIGANTLFMMNGVFNTYPSFEVTPPAAPPPTPLPNVGIIFLGRATIVPEIPIWITYPGTSKASNSTVLEYVSVGTTLYQVLERFMSPVANLHQTPKFTLSRNFASTINSIFTFAPGEPLPSLLDVPLIAGDAITPGVIT